MAERVELLLDGFNHSGMAVPCIDHGDATGKINIPFAFHIPDLGRKKGMIDLWCERAEPFFVGHDFAGQSHTQVGATMKCAIESHDTRPASGHPGDFNRIFHSFCAS